MWHCNINSKQYGPVEIEVLQAWARESRLSPKDLVWRAGMIDWQAADTIPDLKGCFAPPVQSAGGGGGTASTGNKQIPSEAITCMVLGILSIIINCIGLILGLIALSYRKKALFKIQNYPEQYGGEGFCTAGFVTGIIGIIIGAFAAIYWIIVLIAAIGAAGSHHYAY